MRIRVSHYHLLNLAPAFVVTYNEQNVPAPANAVLVIEGHRGGLTDESVEGV